MDSLQRMKKYMVYGVVFVAVAVGAVGFWYISQAEDTKDAVVRYSDTEAGFGQEDNVSVADEFIELDESIYQTENGRIRWSAYWREFTSAEEQIYGNWQRPQGPLRVGIQAGHAKLDEIPEELEGLRQSSGAFGGGKSEAETVLILAEKVKILLETEGIVVDLLPATVPVDYAADAFVSIHADGNASGLVSGFKIAGPRRDFSGKAQALTDALYESYGTETGLRQDANVTRRMSGYYAFNWRRYDHALHPMTPAIIIETGFMTSAADRAVIVRDPDRAARGIAKGIIRFLEEIR
jgi:hypothetical protein